MIKRIFITVFFLLIFSISVNAEELTAEEIYSEQFKASSGDILRQALPQTTKEYLEEFGIDPGNSKWADSLSGENVFSHIWLFVKQGANLPLKYGLSVLAVILICATVSSLEQKGSAAISATYACSIACAALIVSPILSVINASVNAMQGCAVFMTSFVPVFAVSVASSGQAASSVSMSALLLGASQAVSFIAGFIITPLMGGYLALSISASASPLTNSGSLADAIKKFCFWIMSFVTTVFIGILSIQTTLNASADSLSMRTAKFIVGSSVPVAGTVLSESLATVTASLGLLKTSVGLYGVIAVAAIFLPILTELLLWRLALCLNCAVSSLFSLPKISALLKSVDAVMAVLIGVLLLTFAMFVISLTVVVSLK